jgi:hypothetical protein
LVLLVILACEPTSDVESPTRGVDSPRRVAHSVETETTIQRVVNDFGVSPAVPGTVLARVDSPTIRVGHRDVAILAIDRPRTPRRCIVAAQLRIYTERTRGEVAEELAVYPSLVFDAADKREGDAFGYSGSALDIRPRGSLELDPSGRVASDVTDIVRLWMAGYPFPSRSLRAPKTGPIVFTIRDMEGVPPFATATIVSSDARVNRPELVVTHERDCD